MNTPRTFSFVSEVALDEVLRAAEASHLLGVAVAVRFRGKRFELDEHSDFGEFWRQIAEAVACDAPCGAAIYGGTPGGGMAG